MCLKLHSDHDFLRHTKLLPSWEFTLFFSFFENLYMLFPCVSTVSGLIFHSVHCSESPFIFWEHPQSLPTSSSIFALLAFRYPLLSWDFFPLNSWFTSTSKCHQFSNWSKEHTITLFQYFYFENFIQVLDSHNFHLPSPPSNSSHTPSTSSQVHDLFLIIIIPYKHRFAYTNTYFYVYIHNTNTLMLLMCTCVYGWTFGIANLSGSSSRKELLSLVLFLRLKNLKETHNMCKAQIISEY